MCLSAILNVRSTGCAGRCARIPSG
jgi:hypothetical protein